MRRVVTYAALVVVFVLVVIWYMGGFATFAAWAVDQQRSFQNSIALSLRAVRGGDAGAVFALVAACFAYGLAHAAGPGHGKILIGGYGLARKVHVVRLVLIALAASLGQAVTAVVLVYVGVLILNLTRQSMIGVTEQFFAPVSYAAIVAIGLWLMWRGSRRLSAGETANDGDVCSSCGHAHGPTPSEIDQVSSLREAIVLIAGIAIRPCTGALFVLILTWQMGIAMVGILGTFAMAIGTAIVTISVGLAATGLRGGLLADAMGSPRGAQIAAGVEITAGCLVALIAGGLLLRAI